jgi:hypothetical protein
VLDAAASAPGEHEIHQQHERHGGYGEDGEELAGFFPVFGLLVVFGILMPGCHKKGFA